MGSRGTASAVIIPRRREAPNDQVYSCCWPRIIGRNRFSRGGHLRFIEYVALSAFDMGHTPSRAARPLVGWTARCAGIGISPFPSASFPLHHEILVTAFGVVVFSIIVQGLTMP